MNSSYGMRGRSLESAVGKAAKLYERQGRCFLHHRPTPTRQRNDGTVVYAEKAGVDFEGHDGEARALYVECKETRGKSFPLVDLTDGQRRFMDARHRMRARCLLVVDFTAIGETYAISWEHVQAFLLNPWRESLSLDWCRAFGQLVPNADGVCLFLDGVPHMAATECMAAVEAEKARPRQAKLFERTSAKQLELRERLNRPSPKTPAEARARILEAADAGMRRVAKGVRR
jgi:penicillin-binding protein-related factor A (putative recombinase)